MGESAEADIKNLDVENVFVYVGDAVRWDYVPQSVSEQGLLYKTVAASIHSPTSFASLVTGRYPPSHGVFSFKHKLGDLPTLFDLDGFDTRFVNSVVENQDGSDPIFSVLDVEPGQSDPFEDLSEPFVVMERGPGGHAPYTGNGTAAEYFKSRSGADVETLQSEYRSSVSDDAELFEKRVATLEESDLQENTLVIYTSDHGELLGEGGSVGHNAPMRPELIYVPAMISHPDLPVGIQDRLFRHTDLVPTVLAALGKGGSLGDVDGTVGGTTSEPGLSFYKNHVFAQSSQFSLTLSYNGAWTADGGHVFSETGLPGRLAVLSAKLLKSPKRGLLARNLLTVSASYISGDKMYGEPKIKKADASKIISETYTKSKPDKNTRKDTLSGEAREHLQDMGYL